MDGDRKLNLDELEDGASYVVSSYKTFKVRNLSLRLRCVCIYISDAYIGIYIQRCAVRASTHALFASRGRERKAATTGSVGLLSCVRFSTLDWQGRVYKCARTLIDDSFCLLNCNSVGMRISEEMALFTRKACVNNLLL